MKRSGLLVILMLVNIFSANSAWSEIYKWVDANGKAHFSDKAPKNKPKEIKVEVNQPSKNTRSSYNINKKEPIVLSAESSKSVFLESLFAKLDGSNELVEVGYESQGRNCAFKQKIMMPSGRLQQLRNAAEFEFNKRMKNSNYKIPNMDNALFASSLEAISIDYSFGAVMTELRIEGCKEEKYRTYKAYNKVEWQVFDNLKRKVVFTSESEGSFAGSLEGVITVHSLARVAISKAFSVATNNLLASQELADLMGKNTSSGDYKELDKSKPIIIQASKPIRLSSRSQAVRSVKEATVVVRTTTGHGSGFVIDKSGKVITNSHVVSSHKNVIVVYKNKEYEAHVVRNNPERDIALLQIMQSGSLIFKNANIATKDSESGEDVMIIGAPLDEKLSHSVSRGIISAKRRMEDSQIYLQTDAAINPGNSGGPAFNDNGEIVGITVSGIFSQGGASKNINFLIPIKDGLDAINLQIIQP
jgi:S1-C subfamily serine protease